MPDEKMEARATGDERDETREHYRYLKQRTFCEMCSAEALVSHCKIICTSCGYRLTCSDPM